jgi:antitoxin component of MazEF toxin-antitoxin module
METTEAIVKTKKWGNSVGLILPADFVKKQHIHPGDELVIEVKKKKNVLKELFGALASKKTADEVITPFRKGLESKWLSSVEFIKA